MLLEISDPLHALRELYCVLKLGGGVSMTEEFLDFDYPHRATTVAWARIEIL